MKKEISKDKNCGKNILYWDITNKNSLIIDIQLETGKGYGSYHREETYEYNLTGEGYLTTKKLNMDYSTSDLIANKFIYELNWFIKSKNIPFNQRPPIVIINTYQDLE